jgi:hemolysin activation/secretion protein
MKKTIAFALMLLSALSGHAQTAAAQPGRTEPMFDVYEYVIEGNTVLPADVVERVVTPYLGPGRTFKDIEGARRTLEKAYQDAGFLSVLVSLPNQKIEGGEVRLEVNEAPVGRVAVSGAQYRLPSSVRDAVPSLAEGNVPHFPQMQKELAALQSADMQVTPLINASDDGQAIDVDLQVNDKPAVSGSLEFNNGQAFNTSRGRVAATALYTNLFQRGHTAGLSWVYAPYRPSDSNVLSLIYGLPLNRQNDLLFVATRSDSETPTGLGGSAAPTATVSKGDIFGMRWNHRLNPGSWSVRHNLYAGFEYKNNRDANTYVDGLITQRPPLRYTLLTGGYSLAWFGKSGEQTNVNTGLKLSTQSLGGRQVDCNGQRLEQFDCRRAGASADFLTWNIGLRHARNVIDKWRLDLSANVQLATGPLPGGEQYSLGGPATVRGYYDYEQTGDSGWTTRAELISPSWLNVVGLDFSALGFFDRGMVHLYSPQTGQVARTHLGSLGLGLRVKGEKGLEAAVDVSRVLFDSARPVDNGVRLPASGPRADRQYRVDFYVRQAF